jgi:hypothetical protein
MVWRRGQEQEHVRVSESETERGREWVYAGDVCACCSLRNSQRSRLSIGGQGDWVGLDRRFLDKSLVSTTQPLHVHAFHHRCTHSERMLLLTDQNLPGSISVGLLDRIDGQLPHDKVQPSLHSKVSIVDECSVCEGCTVVWQSQSKVPRIVPLQIF